MGDSQGFHGRAFSAHPFSFQYFTSASFHPLRCNNRIILKNALVFMEGDTCPIFSLILSAITVIFLSIRFFQIRIHGIP